MVARPVEGLRPARRSPVLVLGVEGVEQLGHLALLVGSLEPLGA